MGESAVVVEARGDEAGEGKGTGVAGEEVPDATGGVGGPRTGEGVDPELDIARRSGGIIAKSCDKK